MFVALQDPRLASKNNMQCKDKFRNLCLTIIQGRPERGLTLPWQLKDRVRALIEQENIKVSKMNCLYDLSWSVLLFPSKAAGHVAVCPCLCALHRSCVAVPTAVDSLLPVELVWRYTGLYEQLMGVQCSSVCLHGPPNTHSDKIPFSSTVLSLLLLLLLLLLL
jgi:hypothetical protein